MKLVMSERLLGPKGGTKPNYATVADNKPLPPTTQPGHAWTPVKVTLWSPA